MTFKGQLHQVTGCLSNGRAYPIRSLTTAEVSGAISPMPDVGHITRRDSLWVLTSVGQQKPLTSKST